MHIYMHRVQEQDNPLLPNGKGKAKGLLIPMKEYSLAKALPIAISITDRNAEENLCKDSNFSWSHRRKEGHRVPKINNSQKKKLVFIGYNRVTKRSRAHGYTWRSPL